MASFCSYWTPRRDELIRLFFVQFALDCTIQFCSFAEGTMPTIFKGTMIFSGPQHGWTESWWTSQPTNSYSFVSDLLDGLIRARAPLLGNQATIIGKRVSREDLLNEGFSEYVLVTNQNQSPSCDSDEPDACVVAHAYDDTFSRKKAVFLRGIPDSIDIQFGKLVTDPCDWGKAFATYAKKITAGWGWMGRAPGPVPRANLTGYVTSGQNQLTFTLDAPLFAAEPVGKKIKVTFGSINKPAKSVLNGQQVVFVLSPTTCQTVFPTAALPYVNGGHCLYEPPQFNAANSMNYSRIGTRRVGAPLLASRGRLRARGRG